MHNKIRDETKGIGPVRIPVELEASGLRSQIASVTAGLSEKVTVKADADTAPARKEIGGLAGLLKGTVDKEYRVKVDIDKRPMVDSANAAAMLARNLTTLAGPVIGAAALPAITALGGALVQTSGALLLVPAAGAVAATVMGTVRLATTGMADAFKLALDPNASPEKLAEAMAKLSPEARAMVSEVRAVKPAFDSMRLDVQNTAFRGLSGAVGDLSRTYIPEMRSGLTGVAG